MGWCGVQLGIDDPWLLYVLYLASAFSEAERRRSPTGKWLEHHRKALKLAIVGREERY